ncbi:MAG: hypothetical protein K5893_07535 [Prevotella sp.]|nr:hypothetical protein [Prevotella sp.]
MKAKKQVLLLGNHPVARDMKRQFQQLGCTVVVRDSVADVDASLLSSTNELALLANANDDALRADNEVMGWLSDIAEMLTATDSAACYTSTRMPCHLLLRSQTTLWMLKTVDFDHDINQRFDIFAFTMEDQWALRALMGNPWPIKSSAATRADSLSCPPIDRQGIDVHSNQTVHLVVFGLTALGEQLAVYTALMAHFPNYVRDNQLRTRITLVDPSMGDKQEALFSRYRHLFDNSYYRCLSLDRGQTRYHEPKYHGRRDDFVDVEWEFVEGHLHHPLMQQKLALWAASGDRQLLTVALCDGDDNLNYQEAFGLPAPIYRNPQTVVLVRVRQQTAFSMMGRGNRFANVYPIGMEDCGYDVRQPLMQMARMLNYFYACSFGRKGIPTEMPSEEVEQEWTKVEGFALRYSNVYNVMTMGTKMRSLGHDANDWSQFYALTEDEVDQMAAVEHNRWVVDRLMLGFRPPTDDEKADIEADIKLKKKYKNEQRVHLDLCSYRELGTDEQGNDVRIYDRDLTASIPLIANAFFENLDTADQE